MTDSMKAYRLVEWERPPELTEAPVPAPGPGQIVVAVAGNGLCHSDVTMSAMPGAIGEHLGWSVPFTLGHEIAGHVAALGAGVSGFAEGDAVAAISPRSCGSCRWCVRGDDNNCPQSFVGRGYGMDGGLASHVLVHSARELVPLGSLDPLRAGPLTDAGATSYHALRRALPRIHPGGTVVIIGVGGLGAFALQHALVLTGARVVAVDPSPARRDYARELGAHEVLDGVGPTTAAQILAIEPDGADAVLDFVGEDLTIDQGLRAVARGGAFGLVGAGQGRLATGSWFERLPRDGEVFTFQAPTIADTREVIGLARTGQLRLDVDVFPLSRVEEAYAAMEAGTLRGRAVVVPD